MPRQFRPELYLAAVRTLSRADKTEGEFFAELV